MQAQTVWTLKLCSEDQRQIATSVISCQQSGILGHTCQGNKQLTTMCRSQRRSASGGIGPHRLPRMGTTESLSHAQDKPTSIPAPKDPFGEVVHQYTDTPCTTQKQTNLKNSLQQDIAIFNEHDSTKLEEWLMDRETAADLTSEIQAKLAKAKSRGLTCMLVMEAINSEKTWDRIKDVLRLKLCNANIHTYTSNFMDIQQQ